MTHVFFLNDRETGVSLVSVVLLDPVAQLDPVDLLAPLATTELRCVLSYIRKQWNLTRCMSRSIFLDTDAVVDHRTNKLITFNHRAWRLLPNESSKRDACVAQTGLIGCEQEMLT